MHLIISYLLQLGQLNRAVPLSFVIFVLQELHLNSDIFSPEKLGFNLDLKMFRFLLSCKEHEAA